MYLLNIKKPLKTLISKIQNDKFSFIKFYDEKLPNKYTNFVQYTKHFFKNQSIRQCINENLICTKQILLGNIFNFKKLLCKTFLFFCIFQFGVVNFLINFQHFMLNIEIAKWKIAVFRKRKNQFLPQWSEVIHYFPQKIHKSQICIAKIPSKADSFINFHFVFISFWQISWTTTKQHNWWHINQPRRHRHWCNCDYNNYYLHNNSACANSCKFNDIPIKPFDNENLI